MSGLAIDGNPIEPRVVDHRLHVTRCNQKKNSASQISATNRFLPSRVFRRRLELFLAAVAEWDGDVVRLVMAA